MFLIEISFYYINKNIKLKEKCVLLFPAEPGSREKMAF